MIEVRSGTYQPIDLGAKSIVIRAQDPLAPAPVIDAAFVSPYTPFGCLVPSVSGAAVTITGGQDSTTVIEGFVITGGTAQDGAGIHITGSSPTIRECKIVGNAAVNRGGGIYIANTPALAAVTLESCEFDLNTGVYGAGLYIAGSTAIIRECLFTGNIADTPSNPPPGVVGRGGGIYIASTPADAPVVIENCDIVGGNLANEGGGIYGIRSEIAATDTTIMGNTAPTGGGMFITNVFNTDASILSTFTRCELSDNTAGVEGGGAYIYRSVTLRMRDCFVRDNDAGDGGGIRGYSRVRVEMEHCVVSGNVAAAGGGGLSLTENIGSTFRSTTFSDNHAESGGALTLDVDKTWSAPATFENCLFVSNTATGDGGATSIRNAWPTFNKCTLSANTAGESGGAIYANWVATGCPTSLAGSIKITASIISGNFANNFPSIKEAGCPGSMSVTYSIWSGGTGASCGTGCDPVALPQSMIDSGGPATTYQPDGNWYLVQSPANPAVDTGADPLGTVVTDGIETTAQAGTPDATPLDMGFHYGAASVASHAAFLTADLPTVAATGGIVQLELDAGPYDFQPNHFRSFVLLGSAAGTSPGIQVDGVLLPLAYDPGYGTLVAQGLHYFFDPDTNANVNYHPFDTGTHPDGRYKMEFRFPGGSNPSALVGKSLWHAFVVIDFDFSNPALPFGIVIAASNPVSVTFE